MNVQGDSSSRAHVATRGGRPGIWGVAALLIFAASCWLSWEWRHRLDEQLDRFDARTLEAAAKTLDQLITEERERLPALVGVLADDARIRAMVLTPTFDRATVVDLLTDLRATSGATMVAILDSAGTVRAVVGAPEMDQLGLGTSSLVRESLDKPSAQLWAFAGEVGVLSAAAVRLNGQPRALFMLGFELDDRVLEGVQRAIGATGAVFVGDEIVASATQDPALAEALRAAAEAPPGTPRVVAGSFLASSSTLSDSAAAARAAWLVPLRRRADEVRLTRALSWLPAALAGLGLALVLGLALRRPGASPGD